MAQATMAAVGTVLQQSYLGAYAQFLKATPVTPGQPSQCQTIEGACESGSVEFCPNMEGGVVNFAGCANSGITANGTVSITGDQFSGSALFNVTFNDVSVGGTVAYVFDPQTGCLSEIFQNVIVTYQDVPYTIVGEVEYCLGVTRAEPFGTSQEGPIVPASGDMSISIPREGKEPVLVTLTIDPEPLGSYHVSFYDSDSHENLLFCSGNLLSQQLDCSTSPMEY
jgi:hypothetical protein